LNIRRFPHKVFSVITGAEEILVLESDSESSGSEEENIILTILCLKMGRDFFFVEATFCLLFLYFKRNKLYTDHLSVSYTHLYLPLMAMAIGS
jgi:hypothetical protein